MPRPLGDREMIGIPETGGLQNAVIHGVVHEGLSVTTKEGKRAFFAIVDESGRVIEEGEAVAKEAYSVALAVYKNFRIGMGHLRVHTGPNGVMQATPEIARAVQKMNSPPSAKRPRARRAAA